MQNEKPTISISPETHPRVFQVLWKIHQRVKNQQAQAQVTKIENEDPHVATEQTA